MSKPIILVTMSTVQSPALKDITGDTDILYTDRATAAAIVRAGGIPLYLPSIELVDSSLDRYLEMADGLLLTGSDSDVNPALYDEKPDYTMGRIDDERDRLDITLIQKAYRQRKPILGICKGMQEIAVALGGSLYQNITEQGSGTVEHNPSNRRTDFTHPATLAPGSVLYKLFAAEEFSVNGGHRQAVKKLPETLKPVAIAADGVVEAFEGVDYPFLLGIQFHAELIDKPEFFRIFTAFIEASDTYKS